MASYVPYLVIPRVCLGCIHCVDNEEKGYDHYEHFCMRREEEINCMQSPCEYYEE